MNKKKNQSPDQEGVPIIGTRQHPDGTWVHAVAWYAPVEEE